MEVESASFSIVLVNYKTLDLTSICLDFIRKAVDVQKVPVWVVDNYSNDESTDFLRTVDWIHLIERKADLPETGSVAHGRALDIVLERVNTKYLVLMHTDTFVYDPSIFNLMLSECLQDKEVFAVGCVEQINRGMLRSIWRYITRFLKHYYRRLRLALGLPSKEPKPYYETYIKSFCALWNVSIIQRHKMNFSLEDRIPGYEMQDRLIKLGYKIKRISPRKMFHYLDHVQAGTVAAAGSYGQGHRRTKAYQLIMNKINGAK